MKWSVLLLLLLVSCSPKEGDIYENLLTDERIEIAKIDIGRELNEFYTDYNKLVEALLKNSDANTVGVRATLFRVPFYTEADSNKKCFSYEKEMRVEGYSMTVMEIKPLSELKGSKYRKLN